MHTSFHLGISPVTRSRPTQIRVSQTREGCLNPAGLQHELNRGPDWSGWIQRRWQPCPTQQHLKNRSSVLPFYILSACDTLHPKGLFYLPADGRRASGPPPARSAAASPSGCEEPQQIEHQLLHKKQYFLWLEVKKESTAQPPWSQTIFSGEQWSWKSAPMGQAHPPPV